MSNLTQWYISTSTTRWQVVQMKIWHRLQTGPRKLVFPMRIAANHAVRMSLYEYWIRVLNISIEMALRTDCIDVDGTRSRLVAENSIVDLCTTGDRVIAGHGHCEQVACSLRSAVDWPVVRRVRNTARRARECISELDADRSAVTDCSGMLQYRHVRRTHYKHMTMCRAR